MSATKKNITGMEPFPVVGIGASAGGLDDFKKLLTSIPADSGMAYIIMQHLSADHPSNLTEILAQHSKIPVGEIISNIDLAPNHVYIIPENNIVIASNGSLELKQRTRTEKRTDIIDIFFESLAKVHKTYAIGIILSGSGFDGTAGFKIIKEYGGATIAQDPQTAAFKGMPQSAIDADAVDFVLNVKNISTQLLDIHTSYILNHAYSDEETIPVNEEELLYQIINLVFLRTGNDFRQYKQPTLRRRIARRMVTVQRHSLADYHNYLKNNTQEQELLFNDFLIPVTYFFRDEAFFESLADKAFPSLVKNCTNNNIRIWIAGCSTGEEAYSLAIFLHEYLLRTNTSVKVQIFASDISEKCISKARAAVYTSQDVQQISEDRLTNYFTKRDGQYHINKVLRDMCVFATHNFITDPPFAKLDLVSCRNVLIYFNPQLQSKVLGSFHFSLKENGLLFLGQAETVSNAQNLFDIIAKNEKIYSKRFSPSRYVPETFSPTHIVLRDKIRPFKTDIVPQADFKKMASDILFSEFTPASVVIDKYLEILHFHGDIKSFLSPSPGKPNFNILKMAAGNLSFELRNAIIQAKNENIRVRKENLQVENYPYTISFEIVALQNEDDHLMIVFYKKDLPDMDFGSKSKAKNADQERISGLEKELSQMRENSKRVSEEQQVALEELQTTNEELLSSSEELQALNEELETSTEELQSSNEELTCVNDELLERQAQLISTRDYAESIIKTIHEPLLVVDKDFMIKGANPSFYKYFAVPANEIEGFSLFEITNFQWNIPHFKDLLNNISLHQSVIEDYKIEITHQGAVKKTMLVNASRIQNSKPGGLLLLAIKDITELEMANMLLDERNGLLQKHNDQLQFFSAAASQDMQEPLRKILMFCNKFLDEEKDVSPSATRTVQRIESVATSMKQRVSDLIYFSQITFTEKEFKKTDLNLILKKTIQGLKNQINEKNALISVGSIPTMKVIPSQVQLLFNNLISNSIIYAQENTSPEIHIDSTQASAEELIEFAADPEVRYLKISVSDNGIGFSENYNKRIFDPFYRLHSNGKNDGSGLGLTFVEKIVENHAGFIKVLSKINSGTQINIYLPL